MVLLPVVVDLGKVIRTAERSHGRVFHEGDFRLCGYTDTELNRILPDWVGTPPSPLWAPGDTPSLRLSNRWSTTALSNRGSSLMERLSTEGFSPLLSDPLIQNWGYDVKRKGWKAIWIVTRCYSLLILP